MNKTALPAGTRWAVVLSSRAAKALRKIERDHKALDVVYKKIRELSMGNFSDDNHRPIDGTLQHVPMFRAKVAHDLRVIYQIDVQPDPTGNYDYQVIKIFQIESRARVDYQFWAKVSVRLRRTSFSYEDRCRHRLSVTGGKLNENKQYPAMFPHEDYGLGISNEESGFLIEGLMEEERDQIQQITLDQFAPFNKALYNSIVADLEMVLPMVLDEHERAIVSHKGASIVIGRSGTGKTTALIYKIRAVDQEHATQEDREPVRQMFVTRSRVLAQHVEDTYRGLAEFTNIALKSSEELKEMAKQSREDPDRALVEFDTEVDLRTDLPPRYSDLSNSHFPLFISYDKLCSLLEGDLRRQVPGQINSENIRSLIGYDDFLHNYWPSFRGFTHGLEPNLVWSEIIGVIKGSQAAFNSKDGYLSRTEYVEGLSQRQFSLLASVRAKVYSIFELYTKRKSTQHDTDEADRTRVILNNLPKILQESNIDYLYVDEVQDNLMIDIFLLRRLAKSIENTYWSGDSAQTVVAGSSFRINDLKAFTYQDQVTTSGQRSSRKPLTAPQFTTFDLHVNFRSLSGIVCFARSLVQIIHDLFPQTIDLMEPERAKKYGDPPILFTNVQNEAGYFERFLLGSSASNRVVFGAQQSILVRDTAAAEELDTRLQGLCNVLPILDSKGLEFDDVLIYNFFSQSPAPVTAWEYLTGTTRSNQSPPPVLCSELKSLYVAVTRARRRCWIWDSGPIIDELQVMWMKQGLVKTEPASVMVGQLAVSSSKAQWSAKGREYFSHRLYKLAAACFRQSGQVNDAKLSNAYHLMSRAKLRKLRGDTPASREALAAAAAELVSCAELPGIGEPRAIYFHAATCFQDAQQLVQAASTFAKAGRAADGIRILFELHDYKSATNLLANHRETIEKDVFEELREQSRVYLFEHREYKYLSLVFDTDDEKIKYARHPDYRVQLKYILAQHKRYHELAEELLIENRLADAVRHFVEAFQQHRTRASIARAVDLAIDYTESVLLVEATYLKNSQELAKTLIEHVQPFASCTKRESYLKIDLFHSFLSFEYVSIEMIRGWNQATTTHQSMRTLASYLAIKSHSWLRAESAEVLLEYLDVVESYKADIIRIINMDQPRTLLFVQRLLGFTPIESVEPPHDTYQTVRASFITHHQKLKDPSPIAGGLVDSIVHEELPKRLHSFLGHFHTAIFNSPYVRPKISNTTPAERLSFWTPTVMSSERSAVKLHLLRVILRALDAVEFINTTDQCDYTTVGHHWLGRMFEALYLATGELEQIGTVGSLGAVSTDDQLREWLARDWVQLRNSDNSSVDLGTPVLLHFLVRSGLQAQLFDRGVQWFASMGAIFNSNLETRFIKPLQQFFRSQNFNRISEAINALRYILDRNDRPDATVTVHLIEALVRDVIVHMNPSRQPNFDRLLMPLSWARALTHKYKSIHQRCDVEGFGDLCSAIQQISMELRFGTPERWLMDGKRISANLVDKLNLRLCWCISLVIGHMGDFDTDLTLAIMTLRKISSDEMPSTSLGCNSTAAGAYHTFTGIDDQQAALTALCQTFRHESLILMAASKARSAVIHTEP
ncbi:hypothetical protein B0J17DRAFT_681298 [Rhizoctonia solani]|nr:hypothetical protein B0J17DRAFT_681298 [Rhizoctonia solani]